MIDKALELAGREHKRIFLLLGANWCPWCRRLHAAFTENPTVRAAIQQGFVLVYIDVNTRNDKKRNASINERYGNPLQNGLPVMVILDQDGKQLATQETASLAAPTDEEEAKRVMAVLTKWTPPAAPKRSN